MASYKCTTGASGDLFSGQPFQRRDLVSERRLAPELITARILCRRLRAEQAGPDKKRIAHLICLNLMSMLKHGPRRL